MGAIIIVPYRYWYEVVEITNNARVCLPVRMRITLGNATACSRVLGSRVAIVKSFKDTSVGLLTP